MLTLLLLCTFIPVRDTDEHLQQACTIAHPPIPTAAAAEIAAVTATTTATYISKPPVRMRTADKKIVTSAAPLSSTVPTACRPTGPWGSSWRCPGSGLGGDREPPARSTHGCSRLERTPFADATTWQQQRQQHRSVHKKHNPYGHVVRVCTHIIYMYT